MTKLFCEYTRMLLCYLRPAAVVCRSILIFLFLPRQCTRDIQAIKESILTRLNLTLRATKVPTLDDLSSVHYTRPLLPAVTRALRLIGSCYKCLAFAQDVWTHTATNLSSVTNEFICEVWSRQLNSTAWDATIDATTWHELSARFYFCSNW